MTVLFNVNIEPLMVSLMMHVIEDVELNPIVMVAVNVVDDRVLVLAIILLVLPPVADQMKL